MRNKLDFEKLVYQKADEIKAADIKTAVRRRAILSTAAVLCVLTAGGFGIFSAVNHSESVVPYSNNAQPEFNNAEASNVSDKAAMNGTAGSAAEYRESDEVNEVSQSDYVSEKPSSNGGEDNQPDSFEITEDYDKLYSVQYYESNELTAEYSDQESLEKLGGALSGLIRTKRPAEGYSKPNCSLKIVCESGAVWVVDVYDDLVIMNKENCYLLSDDLKSVIDELGEKK